MTNGIEATVALCKCGKVHKAYGVRFEKVGKKHWKYTWAFPIKESTAKHEGYDKTSIVGVIEPTNDYPGCPYCWAQSFVICNCGKLNCDNTSGLGGLFTCEWCGTTGKLGIYDGSGFDSSGDR